MISYLDVFLTFDTFGCPLLVGRDEKFIATRDKALETVLS